MFSFFTTQQIQSLCQQYNLRPSKSFGQNYLLHPEPIEEAIAASDVKKSDTIVEVGPGFGILTFALAEKAKKVYAFEIEEKLKKYWDANKPDNIEIIWGDVLRAKETIENITGGYKVVANIPYQITSPLIKLFLEDLAHRPKSLTLLVQKEVAERICAAPGDMSVLAVAVQYYAAARIVAQVPRHFFYPAPAVDSAVIHIELKKSSPSAADSKNFFSLVHSGFINRRKILIKNLRSYVPKEKVGDLDKIWDKFGWCRTIRAQELSLEDWQKLLISLKGV